LGVAVRMLGDRGEAEDLAQDVFVKVFRALKDFQHEALFTTWLYRVTANSCLNQIQKRKQERSMSRVLDDPEAHPDPAANPQRVLEEKQAKLLVERAIRELPSDQRVVLLLRDIEGLSYEDIAESLGIELGTVRSRLHRARLQIKNKIRCLFPAGVLET
jgi:RNA polymerase sigma-70 factor (ECF subfamily)